MSWSNKRDWQRNSTQSIPQMGSKATIIELTVEQIPCFFQELKSAWGFAQVCKSTAVIRAQFQQQVFTTKQD